MRSSLLLTGTAALLLAFAPAALRAQDDTKPRPKADGDKTPKAEKGDEGEKAEKGEKADEVNPADQKLPWNPFATAAVGDWAAFTGSVDGEDTPMPVHQQLAIYWKVSKVEGDTVTVKSGESGIAGMPPQEKERTFSKKDNPTLDQLFDMKGQKIKDLKIEDEKATVEGKDFACKKYSFTSSSPGGGKMKSSMWLSQEVKGSGLVKMTGKLSQKGPNGQKFKVNFEMHIAGYGSKDKTEWGKTFEELQKAQGGDDDEAGKGKKGEDEKDEPKKDEKAPKGGK